MKIIMMEFLNECICALRDHGMGYLELLVTATSSKQNPTIVQQAWDEFCLINGYERYWCSKEDHHHIRMDSFRFDHTDRIGISMSGRVMRVDTSVVSYLELNPVIFRIRSFYVIMKEGHVFLTENRDEASVFTGDWSLHWYRFKKCEGALVENGQDLVDKRGIVVV